MRKQFWFHGLIMAKRIGLPVLSLLLFCCRAPKESISHQREETIQYHDTPITVPIQVFDFSLPDSTKDTTIQTERVIFQLVHDTITKIERLKVTVKPYQIRLDSVIKTVTIRDTYRTTVIVKECRSKFHHFAVIFFYLIIAILLFYIGLRVMLKR